MNMAFEIKERLTMRRVAEHYGFPVSYSGFIKCPFHRGDRTASLKIYEGAGGWHCFGCHKGGSVVDFVMELFGLNFRQALLRLNADFGLGLSDAKPSAAARSEALEARRAEQREKERKEQEYRCLLSELWYWREAAETFSPVLSEGKTYIHPYYAEAVRRLPQLEYKAETFWRGD